MTYWLSVYLVAAVATKMLLVLSPGLVLWLAIVALIGRAQNNSPRRRNRRGPF